MGFYSPQSLVADARRHGVDGAPAGRQRLRRAATPRPGARPGAGRGSRPVRLGLGSACAPSATELAEQIEAERPRRPATATWTSWPGAVALTAAQLEALATAGAFGCFGADAGGAGAVGGRGGGPGRGRDPARQHDRRWQRPRCRG